MSDQAVSLLAVEELRAGYGPIEVLHGVALDVAEGSVLALLGANGAGKTTLMGMIAGTLRPNSGTIRLRGQDVTHLPAVQRTRLGICLVPERRGVFPNLTVAENLRMWTYARKELTVAECEAVALDRFPQLKPRRRQAAGTLSGGEQQQLAIARALVAEPAVLLLDEISTGLAPLIVEQLYELVRQLAAEGKTIVVVEQFAEMALGVADTAVLLVRGELGAAGTPGEVRERLAHAYLSSGTVA